LLSLKNLYLDEKEILLLIDLIIHKLVIIKTETKILITYLTKSEINTQLDEVKNKFKKVEFDYLHLEQEITAQYGRIIAELFFDHMPKKNNETIIKIIVSSSEYPLTLDEIKNKLLTQFKINVSDRYIHNIVIKLSEIFPLAQGTYGMMKHLNLNDEELENVQAIIEETV
jgi:hypothetical protein